jgi:hypothetical protein
MAIILTQTWPTTSTALATPLFIASGWPGGPTGGPADGTYYPAVISSESVTVSGGRLVSVVDVDAGVVLHPSAWPAWGAGAVNGDGVYTDAPQGCIEWDQNIDTTAGYWPLLAIADGVGTDMLRLSLSDGTITLENMQFAAHYPDIDWSGSLTTGNHRFRLSWRTSTPTGGAYGDPPEDAYWHLAADGLVRLWIDGTLVYDSGPAEFWWIIDSPRAIWIGYFGLVGSVGAVTVQDTTCASTIYPAVAVSSTCCAGPTPTSQTSNGGTGNSGNNAGGIGWTPTYLGPSGAVPQHTDPTTGETLTGKSGVELWAEIEHAGTTYRWAVTDLADPVSYRGGLKEGRLTAIGDVEHALSDHNGNFEGFSLTLTVSDHDRVIRSLLDTAATNKFLLDEVRLYLVSHEGRLAAAAPRVIARAELEQYPSEAPLMMRMTGIDPLFGDFGKFGPDRKFPTWTIPETVFPDAPEDSLKAPIPVIYGEVSDALAVDPVTGLASPKGACPLTYVGRMALTFTPTTTMTADTTQTAVTNVGRLGIQYGGTITTQTPYYRVAPMLNGRIGPPSGLAGGPNNYDPTPHADRVVWDGNSVTNPYIVWQFTNPAWHPFDNPTVDTNVTYQTVQPQTRSVLVDWDYEVIFTSASGGQVWDGQSIGTVQTATSDWDIYVLCLGAVYQVTSIFGSDLGATQADAHPTRVQLDPSARADLLVPGASNWPFATSYQDFPGTDGATYRLTVIYARGQLSEDHKAGRVNMTCNVIGVEDVGDGSGLPIVDFFPAYQHLLDNFVLNDYRSGLWVTTANNPEWEDGTPKVRSSSFTAAQAITQNRIGGYGYRIGWCIAEHHALRDVLQYMNDSGDCRLGVNGHGQLVVSVVDPSLVTTNWTRLEHSVDLLGDVRIWTAGEQLENEVKGTYDWDADQRQYRGTQITREDTAAVTAYRNHRKSSKLIGHRGLRERAFVDDVLQRRLDRLKYGPRYVAFTTHIGGMDLDLGDGLRLTTIEGDGANGFVDRPMIILRRRFDPQTMLTTLTCLDAQNLLFAAGAQVLGTLPIEL